MNLQQLVLVVVIRLTVIEDQPVKYRLGRRRSRQRVPGCQLGLGTYAEGTHNGYTKQKLGVDVTRGSPVLLEYSLENDSRLGPSGGSKFVVCGLIDLGLLSRWCRGVPLLLLDLPWASRLDVLQFLSNSYTLRRVQPSLMPVDVGVSSRCSTNGRQHPLGRVFAFGTRRSTVFDKVIDEDV